MTTATQYKALKDKLHRWEDARERFDPKRFKRGGGYTPDDTKAILALAGLRSEPTNEDRVKIELYEFEHQDGAPLAIHGYVGRDGYTLQNFTGLPLPGVAPLRVTHVEKLRDNAFSSVRNSYETTFRGHRYSGRGYGAGMNLTLKRRAK